MSLLLSLGPIVLAIIVIGFVAVMIPFVFRVVVPTNEVHIVQSGKTARSYGRNTGNLNKSVAGETGTDGNTYYAWPSWVPKIGVVRSTLPLSVFGVDLEDYEAYDSGRLPFVIDVKAFFRVSDSNVAAERINSFEELRTQLRAILQGSVRSILAKNDIQQILEARGVLGEQFTKEVTDQLAEWGVTTVKSIEFMDIRDAKTSQVIHNIMEKKKSEIDKESRVTVAANKKDAEIAEIDAQRMADVQRQDAEQQVGLRTAQKMQVVGIADQQSKQSIQEEARITAEKEMEVKRVLDVKAADIAKEVMVVEARQQQETMVLIATGERDKASLNAEAVRAAGDAAAAAEEAMKKAPVAAQIMLAKEIGSNESYQAYLIQLEVIAAGKVVGVEQAQALKEADLKVIANTGNVTDGVKSLGGMFTSSGGTNLAGMLEGLAQTGTGKSLLNGLMSKLSGKNAVAKTDVEA